MSRNLGVTLRIERRPALMKPVYSATPRPSMATSTTPSGGKVTKVVTIFEMNSVRLTGASKFLISMAWLERGSISPKLTPDKAQDVTQTTASNSANSTAGSGNLLPTISIPFRARFNQPVFGAITCSDMVFLLVNEVKVE